MKKRSKVIIAVVAIVVVLIAAWLLFGGKKERPLAFDEAQVTKTDLSTSVTATGTLEPTVQVEVGTQVSGIVSKLYVDYNSQVKSGQVIAELDKTNLLNELSSQKANLASSKTEYEYQLKNYTRIKELHSQQLVSQSDYETAEYTYIKAKSSYEVAQNNLAKAQTNLGYATIYAPIEGTVLSRAVEEGQTVAASFSTPTLFVIAKDLTQMQVVADVDEADIGGVAEGQRVTFTVDAYPSQVFEGEVTQVRQEATVTSNVVTYEVVIKAPNPDLKLKPGLTASVTIFTLEKDNVLCVPSKALKFSPTTAQLPPMDTIIDVEAKHKVWVHQGHAVKAIAVEVGISSGSNTEILSGLSEGMRVITSVGTGSAAGSSAEVKATDTTQTESSPFMPKRPGGNRR